MEQRLEEHIKEIERYLANPKPEPEWLRVLIRKTWIAAYEMGRRQERYEQKAWRSS